jgi:hypothetical protein
MHMVCIWYVYGMYMVCIWYATSIHICHSLQKTITRGPTHTPALQMKAGTTDSRPNTARTLRRGHTTCRQVAGSTIVKAHTPAGSTTLKWHAWVERSKHFLLNLLTGSIWSECGPDADHVSRTQGTATGRGHEPCGRSVYSSPTNAGQVCAPGGRQTHQVAQE